MKRPDPDMEAIQSLFDGCTRTDANGWAKHCRALFDRCRELEAEQANLVPALEQSLSQWRMYAEMQENEDLATASHAEGALYRGFRDMLP